MLQIEQRFFDVEKAKAQMALKLVEWQEENDLTNAEFLDFLAEQMKSTLKYVLRHEREEREKEE